MEGYLGVLEDRIAKMADQVKDLVEVNAAALAALAKKKADDAKAAIADKKAADAKAAETAKV